MTVSGCTITRVEREPHGVARVLDVEEPSPTPGPAAYQ